LQRTMEQFADGGGDRDGGGGGGGGVGGGGGDACDEGIISSIADCTCIHAIATLQPSLNLSCLPQERGDAV
jgi:hypothetical protein